MTEAEKSANKYVETARSQWEYLVDLALCTHPRAIEGTAKTMAKATGTTWRITKMKIEAIHSLMRNGIERGEIVEQGQAKVLKAFTEHKRKNSTDPLCLMSWKVTAETREAVQTQVQRLGKEAGIRDSETFWLWMHSEMSSWTGTQIRHSAGCPRLRKEEKQ
jgi:type IV pilus biogenesis protein CpaD/CtpE